MGILPNALRQRLQAAARTLRVGVPALAQYSTYDEFLYGPEDDIIQRKGVEAYIDMYRTDPEVYNDLNQFVLLALPDISVVPGGEDKEDKRNADLITAIISDMDGADIDPFHDMFRNACATGFSVSEPILMYVDDPDLKRIVGMKGIYTRPTRSFTEAVRGIEMDKSGDIVLFRQSGPFGGATVEPSQVIYYAYHGGPDNRYGTSILRPCYEPWAAKIKVRRVYQVFMVTNASGIRHGVMPNADFENETKRRNAQAVMEKLSSLNAFTTPDGWKMNIDVPNSGAGAHFQHMIEFLNGEIRRAILGDSSFSAQEGTQGSLASREVSQSNVRTAAAVMGKSFCNSVSEQLFPTLLRLNGYTTGKVPVLKPTAIVSSEQARAEALYSLGELRKSGVLKRDLPEAAELAITRSVLEPLDIQIDGFDPAAPAPAPVPVIPPAVPEPEPVAASEPKRAHIHAADGKRRKQVVKQAKEVQSKIDRAAKDLSDTWAAIVPQIAEQLDKKLFEQKPGGGWKTTDLTAIRQVVVDTVRYKSGEIRKSIVANLSDAYDYGRESAAEMMPVKAAGWNPATARAALQNRVLLLLDDKYSALSGQLYYQIENALMGEVSIVETRSAIVQTLGSTAYAEQYATTIMDTAMGTAFNQARYQQFAEIENANGTGPSEIIGYEFVAVTDESSTEQCQELNNMFFRADDAYIPRPPLHFNCRSELMPVYGDERDKVEFTDPKDTKDIVSRMQANGQIQEGFGGL